MSTSELLDYVESISEPEDFVNEDWAEQKILERNESKVANLPSDRRDLAEKKIVGFQRAIIHEKVIPKLVTDKNEAFLKEVSLDLDGLKTTTDVVDYKIPSEDRPVEERFERISEARNLTETKFTFVTRRNLNRLGSTKSIDSLTREVERGYDKFSTTDLLKKIAVKREEILLSELLRKGKVTTLFREQIKEAETSSEIDAILSNAEEQLSELPENKRNKVLDSLRATASFRKEEFSEET